MIHGNPTMTDTTARPSDNMAAEPDRAEMPSEIPQAEQVKIAELVETLARESAERANQCLCVALEPGRRGSRQGSWTRRSDIPEFFRQRHWGDP